MGTFLPLSHAVATRLVVAVGTRAGVHQEVAATPGAMMLLFALLARQAVAVDDVDANEDLLRAARAGEYEATADVTYDPLWISPVAIREDLGLSPSSLRSDLVRLREMRMGMTGYPMGPLGPPVSRGLLRPLGSPASGTEPVARVMIERTLLAMAGGPDAGREGTQDVIWVDMRAMATFSCRYAPLAYARARAWLTAPGRVDPSWKGHNTAAGALAMDVPMTDVREAIGVSGYPKLADLERHVLAPVVADLAKAGVVFSWQWVRNRRGEATALRLRLIEDDSVRQAFEAQRAAEARARSSDRKSRAVRRPSRKAPEPLHPVEATGLRGVEARALAAKAAAALARSAERRVWGQARREQAEPRRRRRQTPE